MLRHRHSQLSGQERKNVFGTHKVKSDVKRPKDHVKEAEDKKRAAFVLRYVYGAACRVCFLFAHVRNTYLEHANTHTHNTYLLTNRHKRGEVTIERRRQEVKEEQWAIEHATKQAETGFAEHQMGVYQEKIQDEIGVEGEPRKLDGSDTFQ
jgi:hypothetical protein